MLPRDERERRGVPPLLVGGEGFQPRPRRYIKRRKTRSLARRSLVCGPRVSGMRLKEFGDFIERGVRLRLHVGFAVSKQLSGTETWPVSRVDRPLGHGHVMRVILPSK